MSIGDVNRPPNTLINGIEPAVADDWESPTGQPSQRTFYGLGTCRGGRLAG